MTIQIAVGCSLKLSDGYTYYRDDALLLSMGMTPTTHAAITAEDDPPGRSYYASQFTAG